jgi:hypothetical protein
LRISSSPPQNSQKSAINPVSEEGDQYLACARGDKERAAHHFEVALKIAFQFEWGSSATRGSLP